MAISQKKINFFQCHNTLVDFIVPELSGNEVKILWYLFRHSIGFQRKNTQILSISQLRTILSFGSENTVKNIIKKLEESNFLLKKTFCKGQYSFSFDFDCSWVLALIAKKSRENSQSNHIFFAPDPTTLTSNNGCQTSKNDETSPSQPSKNDVPAERLKKSIFKKEKKSIRSCGNVNNLDFSILFLKENQNSKEAIQIANQFKKWKIRPRICTRWLKQNSFEEIFLCIQLVQKQKSIRNYEAYIEKLLKERSGTKNQNIQINRTWVNQFILKQKFKTLESNLNYAKFTSPCGMTEEIMYSLPNQQVQHLTTKFYQFWLDQKYSEASCRSY